MKPSLATSFGWPFLVTLVGVGLFVLLGSCDSTTSCMVNLFGAAPFMLVVAVITGFVAGRVSSSPIGLVAVLAATGLVCGFTVAAGLWYQSPSPEAQDRIHAWLLMTGLAIVPMLPGFLVGRDRRKHVELASLEEQRNAGTIGLDEFTHQMALRGWNRSQDQAPPDHRCGRCGKPLSPVWHGKCKHCGARYADYPPVHHAPPPKE